jgi:hypothetical protein
LLFCIIDLEDMVHQFLRKRALAGMISCAASGAELYPAGQIRQVRRGLRKKFVSVYRGWQRFSSRQWKQYGPPRLKPTFSRRLVTRINALDSDKIFFRARDWSRICVRKSAVRPKAAQGIGGVRSSHGARRRGRSDSAAPQSPVFACLARKNAPIPDF